MCRKFMENSATDTNGEFTSTGADGTFTVPNVPGTMVPPFFVKKFGFRIEVFHRSLIWTLLAHSC